MVTWLLLIIAAGSHWRCRLLRLRLLQGCCWGWLRGRLSLLLLLLLFPRATVTNLFAFPRPLPLPLRLQLLLHLLHLVPDPRLHQHTQREVGAEVAPTQGGVRHRVKPARLQPLDDGGALIGDAAGGLGGFAHEGQRDGAPVGVGGWGGGSAACHWSTAECDAQHSPQRLQHSTAQHGTAQHGTAQRSAAQHSTAQHSAARHTPKRLWCISQVVQITGYRQGRRPVHGAASG